MRFPWKRKVDPALETAADDSAGRYPFRSVDPGLVPRVYVPEGLTARQAARVDEYALGTARGLNLAMCSCGAAKGNLHVPGGAPGCVRDFG